MEKEGQDTNYEVETGYRFDNIILADLIDPPLTTIKQPKYKMGRAAAEILIS